jgi:hypothetical protein
MIINDLIECIKLLWEASEDVRDELIIPKRLVDAS